MITLHTQKNSKIHPRIYQNRIKNGNEKATQKQTQKLTQFARPSADGVSENQLQFLNTSELRISEFAFGFSQRLTAGRQAPDF